MSKDGKSCLGTLEVTLVSGPTVRIDSDNLETLKWQYKSAVNKGDISYREKGCDLFVRGDQIACVILIDRTKGDGDVGVRVER